MLDPQHQLPTTRPKLGKQRDIVHRGAANSQSNSSSQGGSNPAHCKEEQADDHHPQLAEKRRDYQQSSRQWDPQKVSDGTKSLTTIHSECSECSVGLGLDATQMDVKQHS
ncbi:hypothetical protein THAOC_13403 [Thalassiosira oceanica]|uniref:Uncharacterized protein n=1 Tax=Thalassiosira oceanica TaxID=159749 RepID=K0SXK9_THAOC|nr:hypothetical protein THAOC_13403 [Thalassiosira oceanica]|eukprot:EJK65716.1 hypothetical protein THAOC_13403 [Thalassiosira oceanica]